MKLKSSLLRNAAPQHVYFCSDSVQFNRLAFNHVVIEQRVFYVFLRNVALQIELVVSLGLANQLANDVFNRCTWTPSNDR